MPQLLPDGIQDPASLDVLPTDEAIEYGQSWEFHFTGSGTECACSAVNSQYGPHLAIVGNRVKLTNGIDTLAQWIRFALVTERFRWPIYSPDFGTEFTEIIDNSIDAEESTTEIEATINEALLIDERIADITSIEFEEVEGAPEAYIVTVKVVSFAGETQETTFDIGLEHEEDF